MTRELFVTPDIVRRATGSLRTSSVGHGGRGGSAAGSIDGAAADAAVGRLVEAVNGAASALARNVGMLLVAIDDAVGETIVADQFDEGAEAT
jgi:hypothetical protein